MHLNAVGISTRQQTPARVASSYPQVPAASLIRQRMPVPRSMYKLEQGKAERKRRLSAADSRATEYVISYLRMLF